jgi:hypothetical protein
MSLWEFAAIAGAYSEAHGGSDKPDYQTPEEFEDAIRRLH